MPLNFRAFRREIEKEGFTIESTARGHYWVVTPGGGKLVLFAVSHKKNSRGEVYDSYVVLVRRAIREYRSE